MPRVRNNEIRYQILTVANDLFLEKGYNNVLMKEIATACDISPALLQHYFPKKEDILVHIVYGFVYYTFSYLDAHSPDTMPSNPKLFYCLRYGLFYRLLYELLCNRQHQILNIYIHVLFNAPLLQRGISITNRFLLKNTPQTDDYYSIQMDSYLICGMLSQQVAATYIKGTLTASHKQIVNNALTAFFRYSEVSREEETELFHLLDEYLTPEYVQSYLQYIKEHKNDYILLG